MRRSVISNVLEDAQPELPPAGRLGGAKCALARFLSKFARLPHSRSSHLQPDQSQAKVEHVSHRRIARYSGRTCQPSWGSECVRQCPFVSFSVPLLLHSAVRLALIRSTNLVSFEMRGIRISTECAGKIALVCPICCSLHSRYTTDFVMSCISH